mgnify:CR=1 FL=1
MGLVGLEDRGHYLPICYERDNNRVQGNALESEDSLYDDCEGGYDSCGEFTSNPNYLDRIDSPPHVRSLYAFMQARGLSTGRTEPFDDVGDFMARMCMTASIDVIVHLLNYEGPSNEPELMMYTVKGDNIKLFKFLVARSYSPTNLNRRYLTFNQQILMRTAVNYSSKYVLAYLLKHHPEFDVTYCTG